MEGNAGFLFSKLFSKKNYPGITNCLRGAFLILWIVLPGDDRVDWRVRRGRHIENDQRNWSKIPVNIVRPAGTPAWIGFTNAAKHRVASRCKV